MPKQHSQELRSFVTYRIARVQNRLNAQAAGLLRMHSQLSLTEWRVISLSNLAGPATATALAREGQMDKGQISRAVKKLIESGYLRARIDQGDGRQTQLSLTDKGVAIHERLISIMRARQEHLVEDLSEAELETFFKVLESLETQCSKAT